MPNDKQQKDHKSRIDEHAHNAKSQLEKIIQAHPDLALELQPVHDSLAKIALDPHK